MASKLTFLILFLLGLSAKAQISGRVSDIKGEALIGVNVFLKGTYDGSTTDIEGKFQFETSEIGTQILVASMVGYSVYEQEIDLANRVVLEVRLKESINHLNGVVITAGSFEASDEKKSVVLKPLDIAMTAGATADIPGALNTLPGTTINGETGRLFVRGGTSNETQAFIDGALVHNFYSSTPQSVPSRSRFSPFLFKGTFFSTGGYSAEYGQALSSVLSLTSTDLPDETQTDISIMTVGVDAAHTQRWSTGSVYGQLQYTNLNPYNNLVPQTYDWEKGFTSTNGTFMLRQKLHGENMLKVYVNQDHSGFIANIPSINAPVGNHTDLTNDNTYINSNYRHAIGDKSSAYVGASYGGVSEHIIQNDVTVDKSQLNYHLKTYFTHDEGSISLKAGGELIHNNQKEDIELADGTNPISEYQNNLYAGFGEADYYLTRALTLRGGLRVAHYTLLNESALSPRLSMALKTSENSQVSLAYGKFHQLPASDLLLRSTQVGAEKATHYMASYQTIRNRRTFRSEVYFKSYDDLIKYNPLTPYDPTAYSNSGKGFAKGIDLFWRDGKTIKNGDYWITYSFIDTKRDYRDSPTLSRFTYAAKHNVSLVYKHFISAIRTQIGATYSFNSGRPYNDPNQTAFNGSTTKYYSNLSFNLAYLYKPNVILYASATNLMGRNNVFSYEFASNQGADNQYDSRPIGQPAKRFLFVGVFITLTKNGAKNNLENL